MALKHVYYYVRNESPVYVQYRLQDAWGWCTGMTQKDDMGRVVGGGFRVGNSCTPVVDSCQCMAKPIQYCKVKKKKNCPHHRLPRFSCTFVPLAPDSGSTRLLSSHCPPINLSLTDQFDLSLQPVGARIGIFWQVERSSIAGV